MWSPDRVVRPQPHIPRHRELGVTNPVWHLLVGIVKQGKATVWSDQ